MTFESVQLVYFSPTHTSQKVIDAVAEGVALPVCRKINLTYPSDEEFIRADHTLTLFAVPTYAGRVSPTALERLRKLRGDATPAVIVVLYGNRDYEDALLELHDRVKEQGFIPVAGGAFIGEHSYSTAALPTAADRPDAADTGVARHFGREVRERLSIYSGLGDIPALRVKGNFPYKENSPKTPATPATVEEQCTQCQHCIEICPVGAIVLTDEIVSHPDVCIKCCACVKQCPNEARVFDTPFAEFLFKNFHERKEPELFY